MFYRNPPQLQPPIPYSTHPPHSSHLTTIPPYTTPRNSSILSSPKNLQNLQTFQSICLSPKAIPSQKSLISPQNYRSFSMNHSNFSINQPNFQPNFSINQPNFQPNFSINQPNFFINQPNFQPFLANQANSLQNMKRNLDFVYQECMSKLANERRSIVVPSRQRFCKYIDQNNDTYEGEMIGKTRNGYGILRNQRNSEIYNGDWKMDKFHGIGAFTNSSCEKFEGFFDYKNFGVLGKKWKKYEGDFLEGKKQGLGRLYLGNDESFHGYFKDDMINGKGTFLRKNGEIIIGKWRNNELVEIL